MMGTHMEIHQITNRTREDGAGSPLHSVTNLECLKMKKTVFSKDMHHLVILGMSIDDRSIIMIVTAFIAFRCHVLFGHFASINLSNSHHSPMREKLITLLIVQIRKRRLSNLPEAKE